MKRFLLYFLAASFTIISCKKSNDNPPSEEDALAVFELTNLTADARSTFLDFAPQANGDPKLALMQTLDWVQQQPGVSNAFHLDSIYLFIETSADITGMIWFKEIDADGASKFRGGGSGVLKAISAADCNNVVENKNVLIYAPGNDEFLYELKSQVPNRLASSSLIDNVVHLKNEQATIAKISTFSNYGLVLMETHGTSISFLTGEGVEFGQAEIPTDFEQFSTSILDQIGQQYLDYLFDGKLMIGGEVTYDPSLSNWWETNQAEFEAGRFQLWATSKLLETQPQLSNTILFGNFCFSGWTTVVADYPKPIGLGFQELNPISYYAYQKPNGKSLTVGNLESMALEDSVIVGLLTDNDNTGIAHLKSDDSRFQTTWPELYLQHLGQPDWCYESCVDSIIDSRDGKVYRTVCIGNQVWMAENLNWAGAGVCYDNNPTNCDTYGRLYSLTELTGLVTSTESTTVQGLCPDGWHVPSKAEYWELIDSCGGFTEAAEKLRSATGWPSPHSDEFGFNLLPAGYGYSQGGTSQFLDLGEDARFWTSTPEAGNYSALIAPYPVLGFDPYLQPDSHFSCRCVKD